MAAAIRFAAAAPNCEVCEYNPAVLEVTNRYLNQPLRIEGAEWITPAAPGLGIELNEAAVRAAVKPWTRPPKPSPARTGLPG